MAPLQPVYHWPLESHLLEITQPEAFYIAGLAPFPAWQTAAAAIRHPDTRLHFLASRWQLAHVLGRQVEMLQKDDRGRWEHPLIDLSTAHTRGHAALLLSSAHRVGIDVEPIRDKAALLLEKFASFDEVSHVLDATHPPTLLWALKEAVYKWYGRKGLIYRTQMVVQGARFGTAEGEAMVELRIPNFLPLALTVRFREEANTYIAWLATDGRSLQLPELPGR